METPTLCALAKVGTYPDDDGNVRLYHATAIEAADAIVRNRKLIAAPPKDPAERALLRAHGYGGYIYLASSSAIRDDLSGSEVVVAVDVPTDLLPDTPLRETGATLPASSWSSKHRSTTIRTHSSWDLPVPTASIAR